MANIKVEGDNVQLLVRRQYSDKVTDSKTGVERESKMKGKFYWICSCDEGRFIVEENSAIHKDIEAGNVWELVVSKTDDNIEYISHRTHAAVVNRAKAKGELKYYENFYVPEGALSKEDMIGD
jgi:hypothetical protein